MNFTSCKFKIFYLNHIQDNISAARINIGNPVDATVDIVYRLHKTKQLWGNYSTTSKYDLQQKKVQQLKSLMH